MSTGYQGTEREHQTAARFAIRKADVERLNDVRSILDSTQADEQKIFALRVLFGIEDEESGCAL